MKSPPVGVVVNPCYVVQPQYNLNTHRLPASTGSSVAQTGSSNPDDLTSQEYAEALNSSQIRNHNISFKDRGGEDSIPTTSGEPITTDFSSPSQEGDEKSINPSAIEHGDGTNEKGQISFGEKEPDLRPIKLNTVNGIVADTRKEADYAMGISDNPIERAMSGEGIPKTDD